MKYKKIYPRLLPILLLSLIVLGCTALSAQRQRTITPESQTATGTGKTALQDTIPPFVEIQKYNQLDVYTIDTTKCRLNAEQFMVRYAKWLNIDQDNQLVPSIDDMGNKPKRKVKDEWVYFYRHFYKNIPVFHDYVYIHEKNDMVVNVHYKAKIFPPDFDISSNYTLEQVQDMVAAEVAKDGVADSIVKIEVGSFKKGEYKWLHLGGIPRVFIGEPEFMIFSSSMCGQDWCATYRVWAVLGLRGSNYKFNKSKIFYFDPKTGTAKSQGGYKNYGWVE